MNDNQPVAIITGASGLVGSALQRSLEADGWQVRAITRSPRPGSSDIGWSPREGQLDASQLEGATAVVHLAGESVAQRWNDDVKRKIRDSRLQGTRLLAERIASLATKPKVLVSASAIGFYGDRGAESLDETSPAGAGFLADVCQQWEAACEPAWQGGIRVCQARVGLVLSPDGGILGKLITPFRLGAGGKVGDGQQYMSWIVRSDLVRALRFLIDRDDLHGAVNCTAPVPVTNQHFTKSLGAALGRPTVMSVPKFAIRLAAGEMADEMLLAGQKVLPRKLLDAGFEFEYREIEPALQALLG
jgi:uncharacterized protein (TIGR01777 family)